MELVPDVNETDVDELAKVRAFNVERTQLLDLMHDLTTPGRGVTWDNEEVSNSKRNEGRNKVSALGPGRGRGEKQRSYPRASRASSNPFRNSQTGALNLSGKDFHVSLRTSERFATPRYNSASKSDSNLSPKFSEPNANRGKVLDFTKEQERERMRADMALHQSRISAPHQSRPQCTIPITNAHLELLAQPKNVLDGNEKGNFGAHYSATHSMPEIQLMPPLTSSPTLPKVEMEDSGQLTGNKKETPNSRDARLSFSSSLKEKRKTERLLPPPRGPIEKGSPAFASSMIRGRKPWSVAPDGLRPSKASSSPVPPVVRHARSYSPPLRSIPKKGLPEGFGEGESSIPNNVSASASMVSNPPRSLRSRWSLFHIPAPVVTSSLRFSGVTQISRPNTVVGSSAIHLQKSSKVLQQSWSTLPSKSEQLARRKLIQEVSHVGPFMKPEGKGKKGTPHNPNQSSNEYINNNSNSISGARTESFSSSTYSAPFYLVEEPRRMKQRGYPSLESQYLPDDTNHATNIGTVSEHEGDMVGAQPSAVHSLAPFASHLERNSAAPYDIVSSSNRVPSFTSESHPITDNSEFQHDASPQRLEIKGKQYQEAKNSALKRIKKGCPTQAGDGCANFWQPEKRNASESALAALQDPEVSQRVCVGTSSMKSAPQGSSREGRVTEKGRAESILGVSQAIEAEELRNTLIGSHHDPVEKGKLHRVWYKTHGDSCYEGDGCRNPEENNKEISVDRRMEEKEIRNEAPKLVRSQPAQSIAKDEDDGAFIPDPPVRVIARRNTREATQWPPPDFTNDEAGSCSAIGSLNAVKIEGTASSLFLDADEGSSPAPVVVVKKRNLRQKSKQVLEPDNHSPTSQLM